jgi:hypothetical protein
MRLFAVALLGGASLAASPLYAADLFESAPPPMMAPGGQTELGSNWYIRGDVGYGQIDQATVVPQAGLFPTVGMQPVGDASQALSPTRGNNQVTNTAAFGLGMGYRVNDWFRAEADWQYSKGPGFATTQTVFCPEVANAVSNYSYPGGVPTPTPVGYQYDFTTCNGQLKMSQYNNTVLAMGYFDLGHWWLFTPYIGAGAGINVNSINGTLAYNQTDTGATYAGPTVTGTAPGNWVVQTGVDAQGHPTYGPLPLGAPTSGVPQPIGPANWNRNISSTKYSFAGALALGLGVQISQSATLDLYYKAESLDVTQGTSNLLQTFNIGVRYNIN